MLHLPLTRPQLAELHEVIRGSHRARSRAAILTTDHRVLVDRRSWLLDGQVEVDVTAEVTRSAACTLLDPDARSGLDTEAPLDGSIALNRFLQLRRDIWLPHAEMWASIPLFTGPITGVTRAGPVIDIEAQGKELLALQPIWTPITYKKGTRRVEIIEDLMRRRAGEFTFAIPPGWTARRTGSDWNLVRRIGDEAHTVWARAQTQARLLGADMFYDARGTLRARTRSTTASWAVRAEDMAGPPTASETTSEIKNVVVVTGGTPEGGKKPITAERALPDAHPWSPVRLGRRGVGRRIPEHVEDSGLVTQKAANDLAKATLKRFEVGQVEMTVSMLPVYWLEPWDLITIDIDGVPHRTRAHKMTWSLSGDLMSFGHLRNYNPKVVRRR